ncbi:MAG: DoxX family protein [Terracidiphilus sp.]|jgi:putative oxidoreductase
MSSIVHLGKSVYGRFATLANYARSPLLLAIRLYWGWQFAEDGWGKLHHLARVTDYFGSLNLPAPGVTALGVSIIELVGGILLAVGIGSRLVALILFVNMTVAFWVAEKEAFLGALSSPDKFQAADAYNYWFAALLILILGPGLFAVDTLIGRWLGGEKKG